MRQAIILPNADPVHRHIYAALWGDELNVFEGESDMWFNP